MEGFLRGLYQSGVGNPEVQQQQRTQQQEQETLKAQQMKEAGMMPTPGSLPTDHPIRSKIQDFLGSIIGGGGSSKIASAYRPDPNFPKYYQTSTGETSFVKGKDTPLPQGAVPVPAEKGPALAASSGKIERTNIPFDTARSMATLAQKPKALDTVISQAQKEGRDYLTKDEMNNAFKAISTGAQAQRGDFMQGLLKVHQGRLELAQRQAAFGSSGYGKNQLSLNTALQHTSSVQDGLEAINNGPIELLNVPINQLKTHTNDPKIVALEAEVTALSDELGTAFKGSSATDIQMQEWAKFLKTSITPAQAAELMPTIADLLDARLTNLERQQELVAPGVVKPGNILSPSAAAARAKIKGGQTPTINSQAEYDALPSGSEYIDSTGKRAKKR